MIKSMVKSAFRSAGMDVFRASKEDFRWSHTADDFYPIKPRPRWQEGSSVYNKLLESLEPRQAQFERLVSDVEAAADLLHSVSFNADANAVGAPFWNNFWFTGLDAAALMVLLTNGKPKRYLEIGSGHSTKFARHAIDREGLQTEIISIDPHPRDEIDRLCSKVIRSSLEDCDLDIFQQLTSGDVLFFDGSHRLFSNSDVLVFFMEVLPNLNPGVLIQIHDIFLPHDYPKAWNHRLYNEQYLLAILLMYGTSQFETVAAISYICHDDRLAPRVKQTFMSRSGGPDIPFLYPNPARNTGTSFWIRKN